MKAHKWVLLFSVFFLSACKAPMDRSAARNNKDQVAVAHVQLALAYLDHHNVPRAQHSLLHAQAIAPHNPAVLQGLAYFWEQAQDPMRAETYYRQALRAASANTIGQAKNNYGIFLCRQKDYVKGLRYLEEAARDARYPDASEAWLNAGTCALMQKDSSAAVHYFEQSLARDPSQADVYLELASLMAEQKKNTEAMRFLKNYDKLRAGVRDARAAVIAKRLGLSFSTNQGG